MRLGRGPESRNALIECGYLHLEAADFAAQTRHLVRTSESESTHDAIDLVTDDAAHLIRREQGGDLPTLLHRRAHRVTDGIAHRVTALWPDPLSEFGGLGGTPATAGIDAGDTFAYDSQGRQSQAEREQAGAEHLFGLLPADQAGVYIALWHEFEAAATAEAKLANAVDRLMPLLHNYYNDGGTWRENSVNRARVEERVGAIEAGSTTLWSVAQQVLDEAVTKGYLRNANQEESGQA